MSKRPKTRQTLEDILASCSETLFPAEMGQAPVAIDSHDVDGDTPLHVMLWREDLYAVRLLVDAGADVNAVGDMSETPLHIALRKENLDAAALLIAAGARLSPVSEFGQTPRNLALSLGGDFKRLLS